MPEPTERFLVAKRLLQAGRYEEAATELLWCLDNRTSVDDLTAVLWSSLAPKLLLAAGQHWPQAAVELEKRLQQAEALLLQADSCDGAAKRTCRASAALFEAATAELRDAERLLKLYQRLEERGDADQTIMADLWPSVFRSLWDRQRYDQIVIRAHTVRHWLDQKNAMLKVLDGRRRKKQLARHLPTYIDTYSKFFLALLATGRQDEATMLAEAAASEKATWSRSLAAELIRRATERGSWSIARKILDLVEKEGIPDAGLDEPTEGSDGSTHTSETR